MAELRDVLADRFGHALEPSSTADLDELAAQLAPDAPPRQRNPALAAALLGESRHTVDRSSRAYKAALRNVERWRRGETAPRAESRQRIAQAARSGTATRQRVRRAIGDRGAGVGVQVFGTVRVSADVRRRREGLPTGDRRQQIDHDALTPMVDAIARGEWGEAAAAFEMAFFDGLGIDPDQAEIEDVGDDELVIESE